MAKEKTTYICGSCKTIFPKWSGQCSTCKTWNTIEEYQEEKISSRSINTGKVIHFSQENKKIRKVRISTGMKEADRVFGGGLYPDSLTLLIGNPGIGKSTLALQIAMKIAQRDDSCILVFSGEESAYQVCSRAERLGGCSSKLPETSCPLPVEKEILFSDSTSKKIPENLKIASAFQIEDVVATAKKEQPALILVDSVQTFSCEDIASGPGSLPQIYVVFSFAISF